MTNSRSLNQRACELVEQATRAADDLGIRGHSIAGGGRVIDFGVEAAGGLAAGAMLADICLSGLAEVRLVPGLLDGVGWPQVFVATDRPVEACLLSQYAGWQINVDKFFAMGSGPMRAAAAVEELFERLNYRESAETVVGVLEGGTLPDKRVINYVAEKTGVAPERVMLLIAPTSSVAGNFQIVARSVETALHKLFELGFDVGRVASACGVAPLAPVAKDDLAGIGRTNDAILYGARVTLSVRGDDRSLVEMGPRVPASASAAYGKPFLDIFEEAGRDFYSIDPLLFSPAEIVFQNLESGRVHQFGAVRPDVLRISFGLGASEKM